MTHLTALDIKTLTDEPSANVRGMLAGKIAMEYRSNQFSATETAIADDILRALVRDTEIKIRQSVASQLADCPYVPHDIILKLANDEPEVSVDILERSPVLSEDDLIAIVKSTYEIIKLCAIARRESISEDLSTSLMETDDLFVLQNLLKNRGAAINERELMKFWETITSHHSLLETLVHRGGLPFSVAGKLYMTVSEELKEPLQKQYKSFTPHLYRAVNDAQEWELLGLSPSHDKADLDSDEQVVHVVQDLYTRGRLTHSLLIRALCVGNLKIFEAGIAKLAKVPRVNARILLMESSGAGLKAIYKAAHMPEGFYEAIKVLLRISLEETEFGKLRHIDFRKRVVDRIYMGQYHHTIENMEYLLSIIGGKMVANASVH